MFQLPVILLGFHKGQFLPALYMYSSKKGQYWLTWYGNNLVLISVLYGMTSVTEWRFTCDFTAAEKYFSAAVSFIHKRPEGGTGMRAITKWLL